MSHLFSIGTICIVLTIGTILLARYNDEIWKKIRNQSEGFSTNKKTDSAIIQVDSADMNDVIGFKKGTRKNPFSNVLLTDIANNPDKQPAPPAYHYQVASDIRTNMKKIDILINPKTDTTNEDLYANFEIDRANHIFYSMPNTKIVNDQTAFAQMLYGNQPSGKEDTADGNIRRFENTYRHIMI